MDVRQELMPGLPDDVAIETLQRLDYTKITVFASVCRRWKEELHSPNFLHRRRMAGLTQSFLAFLLEENHQDHDSRRLVAYIALYDLKSYQWLRSQPIPNYPQNYLLQSHRPVQAGHRILVIKLCRRPLNAYNCITHIYDMLAGAWRFGAPNPFTNWQMYALASDGVSHVFLAGGLKTNEDNCKAVSTAALYDVDADTWRRLPDMVRTRVACDGYFYNGIFYVIGRHEPTLDSCAGERYDTSTGIWSLETGLETDACFLSSDGKYYQLASEGHRMKLMVKQGRSWASVGYLPGNISRWDYRLLSAFEGGFAMIKRDEENPNIVYLFSLSGDENGNIRCQTMRMPFEYRGTIISGSSLEV